jgi:hypothetical protein
MKKISMFSLAGIFVGSLFFIGKKIFKDKNQTMKPMNYFVRKYKKIGYVYR